MTVDETPRLIVVGKDGKVEDVPAGPSTEWKGRGGGINREGAGGGEVRWEDSGSRGRAPAGPDSMGLLPALKGVPSCRCETGTTSCPGHPGSGPDPYRVLRMALSRRGRLIGALTRASGWTAETVSVNQTWVRRLTRRAGREVVIYCGGAGAAEGRGPGPPLVVFRKQKAVSQEQNPVRIAVVGAGAVTDYHHAPGIRLDPRARLVAACDADQGLLDKRKGEWGLEFVTKDYRELCESPEVDGIIIATPNDTHRDIAVAAARGGKHVMCEKPLGLDAGQVREMYEAARDHGVVHMTAFTYRFAPAMMYLKHLLKSGSLGEPRHFRSQRFLDLPETSWGWRQYKERAGAGDLFDMTIHRIDFAIDLLGPISRVSGAVARFAPRTKTADGRECKASEVDDWSALIGEFECGATGVWEGTTLAKGYKNRGFGHEWAEVNGSEGSAVYRMHEPNAVLLGRHGGDLEETPVPAELLKPAGSPRTTTEGDPATLFRYDLAWEFVSAIVEKRQAVPSFWDGLNSQLVADAVLESFEKRNWVDTPLAAR